MFKILSSLFLFLITIVSVEAQYIIDFIGSETLPNAERNYFVSQSEDGIYWLGSPQGLTRFDGYTSRKIPIRDTDVQIYHDQNVQTPMIPDGQGLLWFSTFSAVHAYDPDSGKFKSLQVTENGLPIEEEYRPFFFHRPTNELWLRAGASLWALDTEGLSFRPLGGSTSSVHFSVIALPDSGNFRVIGSRWRDKGLESFDIRGGEKIHRQDFHDLPCNIISSIPLSPDSIMLATMYGLYLAQLNGQQSIATPLDTATTSKSVGGLIRLPNQNFLVSSFKEGIREFDLNQGKFVNQFTEKDGLASSQPRNLFQDHYGQVWVTHAAEGLNVLRPDPAQFINRQFPEPGNISDFLRGPDGAIWAVTRNGDLWTYKDSLSTFSSWQEITNQLAIPNGYRPSLHKGKDTIYLMEQNTLQAFSLINNDWTVRQSPYTPLRGLFSTPLASDVMLSEKGLQTFKYHEKGVKLNTLDDFTLQNGQHFTAIHELTDTSFLLAYQGTEVWHIVIRDQRYHITNKVASIGDAYCALQTSTNEIYIGTSVGLFRLVNDVMTPVVNDHLIKYDLIIESIFEADDKGIWLGTHKGLFRYDPIGNSIINFSTADGLPTNRFLRISPTTLSPSEVWMATNKGLFSFNPLAYSTQQVSPLPYIDQIWLNNVVLSTPEAHSQRDELEVDHRRNSINFQLSAIGFSASDYKGIAYKADGLDKESTLVDFGSIIRYRNIPPGSYTLELTAINRNGLPSGKKSLTITIRPPFTQTLFFYILCTCGLALFAAGLYIMGLRRERLKQERQQEQQARLAAERDRIAGEVHDDLGGQISSILYLSEEMLLTGDTPEYEYELSRINELSRSSLQNVRDIIFALDNRRASLSALGEQLSGAGEAFFGDRKIGFQNSEAYSEPDFVLTSRQKRNLTLIIKEAWHNIAKHAKSTLVTLDILERNKQLIITVTDNGVGFSSTASEDSMGGYGLDNMKDKATVIGAQLAIDSTPGQGTSLQITWPLPTND